MSTIGHSTFLKADTRSSEAFAGVRLRNAIALDQVVVRDIFLSGGAEISLNFAESGQAIIVPIVGLPIIRGHDADITLSPGDIYRLAQASHPMISNSHPEESINFLCIIITAVRPDKISSLATLDIIEKNVLVNHTNAAQKVSLGVYDGRREDVITIGPDKRILAYIVNGAFEVDGRLMEHRDGLLLWEREQIEFEALSEAAIILLLEF